MHRMTPNYPWTLNSDKCSEAQILVYFAPQPKYKNTESPENPNALNNAKLEYLTVKSTLYTLNTPEAIILACFALRLAVSERQYVHRKSEMHPMTANWTWAPNIHKYPICTK